MKISKTSTPIGETLQYFKKTDKTPSLWVIIEEINKAKPQSKLMRFRLGASTKKEADEIVKKLYTELPIEIQKQLTLRIEKTGV